MLFISLFLLISFGSVCAVMFTPALPQITAFFGIEPTSAQLTISLYLIGYAVGQLIYGPLTYAYGRKKTLYIGSGVEIIAALLCAMSAYVYSFGLLVFARLLLALGASVGVKMTFTLVADCYSQEEATRIISHLMMAFAIAPGLSVALGGFLSQHFYWTSSFYFLTIYGFLMLCLVTQLPETSKALDKDALKFSKIITEYNAVVKKSTLVSGGFLLGLSSNFIYLFASVAPFIAMSVMHLNPTQYGVWNLLPPVGLVVGSQLSAYFSNKLVPQKAIVMGIGITALATVIMLSGFVAGWVLPIFLFIPLMLIYFGLSFVFSNGSMLALSAVEDKSSGSAMMNFINLGTCVTGVVLVGFIPFSPLVLPIIYAILSALMFLIVKFQ